MGMYCSPVESNTTPPEPTPGVTFRHEKFRLARIAQGFTQSALAKVLGVDGSTVSRWEAGSSDPLPRHVEKICALLALSPEDLYLDN
jgi:transcriptional regulator with XRE-family HTH domain